MANDRLYVGFFGDRVDVYDISSPGNAPLLHSISGSNTHLNGITAIAVDSAGNIYVANAASSEIAIFDPSADGNIAPVRILTGLGVPSGLAFDSLGNLYALNTGGLPANRNVTVYAPGVSGNAAPIRTVSGIQVADGNLIDIAVDMYDQLYVCGDVPGSLNIYPPYANGSSVANGSRSGFDVPVAMDFDGNNNLYVSDDGLQGVLMFTSAGAPRGKIGTGGALAVDQFGIVYTATDEVEVIEGTGNVGLVSVYAPGGSGYSFVRSFQLAWAKGVSAMAINKPRPPIPPRLHGRMEEIVATLMTAGVPRDGGGIVFIGPVPIPVGPWGPLWGAANGAARRDLLIGLAIEQLASEVRDKGGQRAIRRAALELVKAKGEELLGSID